MASKPQEQEKIRCVIYTRKSVEDGLEQEFNSLDAQRQAAECYIESQKFKGWTLVDKHYDDGGFSGGSLNRPAIQDLLDDAAQGRFDIVVVYKIDRLSRSIVDFAELSKKFDEYGVSFVSVTQDINTTTSSGRMMLNILMTFAQYEREIIAERIKDKMSASRKLGKWVGGTVPYGYKLENKKLVINENEAPIVRRIFEEYATNGSVRNLAEDLRDEGIRRTNGKEILSHSIRVMLRNPTYIGKVKYENEIYNGEHEAIISEDLWERVQEVNEDPVKLRFKKGKKKGSEPANLYSGLIRCGHCNSSMISVSGKNNNKVYRYLLCNVEERRRTGRCPVKRIPQVEVEELIFSQIKTIIQTPSFILAVANKLQVQPHLVAKELRHFLSIWRKLPTTTKRKIIKLLIEKVVIYKDHVDIEVKTNGANTLMEELVDANNNTNN